MERHGSWFWRRSFGLGGGTGACIVCLAFLMGGNQATAQSSLPPGYEQYDLHRTTSDNWSYGWHFNEATGNWEYGRYFDPQDSFTFGATSGRDYGWYFDEISDSWKFGWHTDVHRPSPGFDPGTPATFRQGSIRQVLTERIDGQLYVLADLRMDDGRLTRVNLGPVSQINRLNLSEGDRISFVAEQGTLGGRPMLLAARITGDGKTIVVRTEDQGGEATVHGEIENVYLQTFGGVRHLWAELDTDRGDVIVDLGPARRFARTDIRLGDDITVSGERGRMRGRPILVADHVITESNRIVHVERDRGRFGRHARTVRDYTVGDREEVRGEILGMYTREHRGHDHLIATIRTAGGNTIQTDLGPRAELRGIDLDEGDFITVIGEFDRFRGQLLFKAEHLRAGGQSFRIGHTVDRSHRGRTDLRTFRGEVMEISLASVEGFDEDQVVARIKTDDGEIKRVVLGSRDRLGTTDFTKGKRIVLLASDRPNTPYAYAESVYVDGKEIQTFVVP